LPQSALQARAPPEGPYGTQYCRPRFIVLESNAPLIACRTTESAIVFTQLDAATGASDQYTLDVPESAACAGLHINIDFMSQRSSEIVWAFGFRRACISLSQLLLRRP
jgi:hypothetical protein